MNYLLLLPCEIILDICKYLPNKDIKNLSHFSEELSYCFEIINSRLLEKVECLEQLYYEKINDYIYQDCFVIIKYEKELFVINTRWDFFTLTKSRYNGNELIVYEISSSKLNLDGYSFLRSKILDFLIDVLDMNKVEIYVYVNGMQNPLNVTRFNVIDLNETKIFSQNGGYYYYKYLLNLNNQR